MSTPWRFAAVLLAAPLFFGAPANSVSFDCSKAQTADQKAICGNDLASQLDDIADKGYRFLKPKLGKRKINQLNREILQYRQRCGGDIDCIVAVQIETIRIFKKLGAPISLPSRSRTTGQAELQDAMRAGDGPSFDCAKARLPDERAICRSPELSALDRLTTEGFRQLESARGKAFANRLGKSFLDKRHSCGDDIRCIKEAQASAIAAYRTAAVAGAATRGQHVASSSTGLEINQDKSDLPVREQFKAEPYEMMNFDWSRDNGRPVIVGTVASADAMCGVLSHPLFSHSAETLRLLGTMNGSPKIDPDNLASRWLNDRASEYALNVRDRGWIPTEPTDRIINTNLAACLKVLQERAPSAYDNVTRLFITSLSDRPPCFGQDVIRVKKLNVDGVLVETEEPNVSRNQKCADFSYDRSLQRGEGTRSGDVSDTLFLAALSLREAHKALTSILDAAEARLDALQGPGNGQTEKGAGKSSGSDVQLTQESAPSVEEVVPDQGQPSIFDGVASEVSSDQDSARALSDAIESKVLRRVLSGEGRSFEVTSIQSLKKFSASAPGEELLEDSARRPDWYVNDERQNTARYQGHFGVFNSRENTIVVAVESHLGRELIDSITATLRDTAVEKRTFDPSQDWPFGGWAKSFDSEWDGLLAVSNNNSSIDVYAFKNIQDPKYSTERKAKRNPEGLSDDELLRKALRRSIYTWQYREFADEYAPVLPNLRVRFMDEKNAVIEEHIVKRWDSNGREPCPRTAGNSSCPKYASDDGVIQTDRDWTNLDGPCFLQPSYFNCAVIMPVSRFNIYIDRDPKTLGAVKRIDFSLVPN